MASAKKDTKDRSAQWKKDKAEKAQTFVAAASSTQKEDSSSFEEDDKEKKYFMKSFMASWKSSQKDKKSQKNKCKRTDNDTSDYEQTYSKSSKLVESEQQKLLGKQQ
jgi:hypothetical protein